LFTGDAEKPREKILLSHYGKFLQSAGLKAAHHGSRTAASEEFLRAVNPLFTVISAGRGNRYEHPHNETLARIRMSGAALYRTDISGAVLFRSDGHELHLIPWR
jgi:competence protein ComEC